MVRLAAQPTDEGTLQNRCRADPSSPVDAQISGILEATG
jgi:hypothetical protein